MKTKLCFVLCIWLMSWPITGFTQTWMSLPDCNRFINDKLHSDKMYALGYLTAVNLWRIPKKDILQDISSEQVFLYVENYCRKNLLDKINAGLDTLIIELMKK